MLFVVKLETYNDSSNWIHPIINVISEDYCNESDDVCDDVEEVILSISFNNLVTEGSAVKTQEQFDQCNREHDPNHPTLLLFC